MERRAANGMNRAKKTPGYISTKPSPGYLK